MPPPPVPLDTLETRLVRIEALVMEVKDLLASWDRETKALVERLTEKVLQ